MDISENQLAGEDLSLYHTLINQSNDAIFLIDADTSAFLYVNDQACSILGYSRAELLALQVIDISMVDINMPGWHRRVASLRKQSRLFETVQIRKDGTFIPVEVNASFFARPEKNYIISVARDISDRQAQGRALLEERNKLESLFATLSDGITVQDTNFKILYQNKVHIETQGLHTGEYCYQAYRQRTAICEGCLLVKAFADGKVHRRQTTAPGKKGPLHLEIIASPMKDAAGTIIAGMESVRDISVQKKLEEQLVEAQRMEAIGTLAGGIAHDFNNILTPILGYSELALTRITPDHPLGSDLQQIIKAALRAKDMIQQILAFSHQTPQEPKPLQPHLMIKEALKLLRASLPATIEIREEISTKGGAIMADPTQLHQIVMNLCTNAYHAMRESGGRLGVRLYQTNISKKDCKIGNVKLVPGKYFHLEISDTGPGIERKNLSRIFEPYFTTKGKGEGTGLGLFIVHGIVKSFKGQITVVSQPGEGTCFHIYLPMIAQQLTLEDFLLKSPLPTGAEKVLVVDDEETITAMLKSILSHLGYEVIVTNSSEEALQLLSTSQAAFDLLITDMTMPNLTGLELIAKALDIHPDLPVILCTGYSELVSEEQARALGIHHYLMKPLSVYELTMMVRKALDEKMSSSNSSSPNIYSQQISLTRQ